LKRKMRVVLSVSAPVSVYERFYRIIDSDKTGRKTYEIFEDMLQTYEKKLMPYVYIKKGK